MSRQEMTPAQIFCPHCGAQNRPQALQCFACMLSLTEQADADLDVLLLGHYKVQTLLGQGGYGVVYKALDTRTKQTVAIKITNLCGVIAKKAEEVRDTFEREVRWLRALHHRSLPKVHFASRDQDRCLLVMDFIEGQTLEQYLEKQGSWLPLHEVLKIAIQLCDVLFCLHKQTPPIIFRDIKPSNIMIDAHGFIYLIDFGIARQFRVGMSKDTQPLGSPGYAAPEQYGRGQSSIKTDIYGFGILLVQLLTGIDPTLFDDPFVVAKKSRQALIATSALRPLPDRMQGLLASMLSMDLTKRPDSMSNVGQELKKIQRHLRKPGNIRLSDRRVVMIGLLLTGALEAGAYFIFLSRDTLALQTTSPMPALNKDSIIYITRYLNNSIVNKLICIQPVIASCSILCIDKSLVHSITYYNETFHAQEKRQWGRDNDKPEISILQSGWDKEKEYLVLLDAEQAVAIGLSYKMTSYGDFNDAERFLIPEAEIHSLSANGRFLATASKTHNLTSIQISEIDLDTHSVIDIASVDVHGLSQMQLSPDGSKIVIQSYADNSWIYSRIDNKKVLLPQLPVWREKGDLVWSSDSNVLACINVNSEVSLYKFDDNRIFYVHSQYEGQTYVNVALSSNGERLATIDNEGHITVWEFSMSKTIPYKYSIQGYGKEKITNLIWSNDDRYLIGSFDNMVYIWDIN